MENVSTFSDRVDLNLSTFSLWPIMEVRSPLMHLAVAFSSRYALAMSSFLSDLRQAMDRAQTAITLYTLSRIQACSYWWMGQECLSRSLHNWLTVQCDLTPDPS